MMIRNRKTAAAVFIRENLRMSVGQFLKRRDAVFYGRMGH